MGQIDFLTNTLWLLWLRECDVKGIFSKFEYAYMNEKYLKEK